MRKLETMSSDEFCKMLTDIGKGHYIEGKKIEAAQTHHPDRKVTYGFGYKKPDGYFQHIWEFQSLTRMVRVCDWLDYYGFDRPKWRPDHAQ